MELSVNIPDHIKEALEKHNIRPDALKLAVKADLTPEGEYCDIWIGVTDKQLVMLTGAFFFANEFKRLNKLFRSFNSKNHQSENGTWEEKDFYVYPIDQIDDIVPENLVSTGMLTAKVQGEEKILCRYSNSFTKEMNHFAKLFRRVKEGNELTAEDYEDKDYKATCPKCGRMYPDNRKVCPNCLDRKSLFLRVLSFTPRYKKHIIRILLCMGFSSALRLLSPFISGNILFDEVLTEGGKYYGRILEVILLIVLTQVAALLISIIQGRVTAEMSSYVVYDLRTEIFNAMQRLSMSFFSSKSTGNLMSRVNGDSQQLQTFFHDGLPYLIVNSITIISIVVIMVSVNWKLALLVLLPTPFITVFLKNMFPKLWSLYGKRWVKSASMNSLIHDTLTGIRVVKAFGKEDAEIDRFAKSNEEVYAMNLKVENTTSTVFPLVHFALGIGGLIVWGVGGWQVIKGEMTFGTLITFTGYINMIYSPLQFMSQVVNWWSSSMNAASRIFEVLDAVPEVAESAHPVSIPDIKGDVVLKNVTFSYEINKPVIQNVSLEVKAGEMIGLVGHSGAGKSTITNLITRMYDVEEGEILIDGVNIRDISIKDLRRQIGVVPQETYLFYGTIAENIAYAKPDATMEEIIAAAKIANAHDFIIKLPDGYDTVVGRRGYNMSGGERQRIAIARAILHNPRILILDEATASVDTETERQIQEALDRLVKGRTTFAIAHRLSTLRNADRLVVIEKGRIVEVGTHEELMLKKGAYYNLIQKQREALKLRGIDD